MESTDTDRVVPRALSSARHPAHSLAKRLIDVCGSAIALLLLSPLLLVVTALVAMDSPGPVLYRRQVLGLDGDRFDALKFRTMVANADSLLQSQPDLWAEYQRNVKLKQDPRVTRIGHWLRRLSIDELPQLFNVLRGEMSLVGPRMITREELPRYGAFAAKRLSVRPGVTGLWQVSGRQDVSYETRIQLDVQYVEHWSLALDAKILLKTIPAVVRMQGAY